MAIIIDKKIAELDGNGLRIVNGTESVGAATSKDVATGLSVIVGILGGAPEGTPTTAAQSGWYMIKSGTAGSLTIGNSDSAARVYNHTVIGY